MKCIPIIYTLVRYTPIKHIFMRCTPVRYTLMCEVHACICKMHVYEIYAAVSAHLGGTCLGDVLLALASLLPTVPMS
jgi:hypothetical protein